MLHLVLHVSIMATEMSQYFPLYQQAKVNNTSLVGVGYTQTLRPGTDMNFPLLLFTLENLIVKGIDFFSFVSRNSL